jgi:hypothetical protein
VLTTASVVTSIVSGKVYARPTYAVVLEWLVAIAVIVFAAFVLPRTGVAFGALASVLFIVILGVIEVGLLSSSLVWVRFIVPALALVVGYGLFVPGELMRRATSRNEDQKNLSASSLRNLGQQFQRTGQLDLAFETYRRCPLDAATMDLLYQLGNDFEKRRQNQKASNVYSYIAARDPNYRDLRARRTRLKEQPMTRSVPPPPPPEPQAPASTPPELDTQPADPDLAYANRATRARRARSAATKSSASWARARWAPSISPRSEDQPRGCDQSNPARAGVRGGRSAGSARAVLPRGRNGGPPQPSGDRHGLRCGRRPGTGLHRDGIPARHAHEPFHRSLRASCLSKIRCCWSRASRTPSTMRTAKTWSTAI